MAPVRWTTERDQKLLLLLLEQITVRGGFADVLAAKWKTNYVDTGMETFQPSGRAITEHLGKLQSTFGGKASSKSSTPKAKSTPKTTPRKPAAIKTPKSSAKRKRTSKSSDEEDEDMPDGEDDSEAKRKILKTTLSAPRSALSRRSKSVAKTYHEEDDESDDGLARPGDDARNATPTPTSMVGEDEQLDFFVGGAFDGVDEAAQNQSGGQMEGVATAAVGGVVAGALTPQSRLLGGSKKARSVNKRVLKNETSGDDSDGSLFSPDV